MRGWRRSPSRSVSTASRRYRKAEARDIRLDLPQSVDRDDLDRVVEGVTLARDLINTPANDLGPART